MFEKPRPVSSLDSLQQYLHKKGGSVPGLHGEIAVSRGEQGEIIEEDEFDVPGTYALEAASNSETPLVVFRGRGSKEGTPDRLVSEKDILEGSVQVIARRRIK